MKLEVYVDELDVLSKLPCCVGERLIQGDDKSLNGYVSKIVEDGNIVHGINDNILFNVNLFDFIDEHKVCFVPCPIGGYENDLEELFSYMPKLYSFNTKEEIVEFINNHEGRVVVGRVAPLIPMFKKSLCIYDSYKDKYNVRFNVLPEGHNISMLLDVTDNQVMFGLGKYVWKQIKRDTNTIDYVLFVDSQETDEYLPYMFSYYDDVRFNKYINSNMNEDRFIAMKKFGWSMITLDDNKQMAKLAGVL